MEDLIFEIKRKLVHVSSVIYILLYCIIKEEFSQRTAILSLILILIILSLIEFIKMRFNKKIPFFHKLYRENEKNNFSGSIFLVIGIIVAFSAFEFNIAITAIIMMIFGDTASAIVGRIGNHRIGHINVSVDSMIAEFFVDIAIGFIFLNNFPIILIMAFTATAVEILLKPVDDNLAVPVVAGFAGQALLMIMRIFNLA